MRCIVERAAAQSEALELLLVVALADAMLSPAFVDELPRIVPTVLEGQRDNDPERALMARHTAALLASVLEIARAALLDARIEVRESAEGRCAARRCRSASRSFAPTLSPRRARKTARRCARPRRADGGCSTLRRRWRSTRLPRRASVATPRAVPRPSSSARAAAPSTSSV